MTRPLSQAQIDRMKQAEPSAPLDPITAAEELGVLLALPSVEVEIRGAQMFGSGSRAALEIKLSNGEVMTFDQLKDMANLANLSAELVACSGATPKLTKQSALTAVALTRRLAEHYETDTDNDLAVEWGVSFMQAAQHEDFDLDDQADRWRAFSLLERNSPWEVARHNAVSVASASIVLRHTNGMRLVRSHWFGSHVKQHDSSIGEREVPKRMARVGWIRRGREGRVKATRPDLPGQLNWSFYFVPAGWENQ